MSIFDASAHSTEFPLEALRSLTASMGDWLLIGAFARNLVVNCAAGLPRGSETFDVDIAIAVADDDGYRARVAALAKEGGSRIRYRTDGMAVDVIGYGGIAPDNELEDRGTILDVTGMAEAHRCAMAVRFEDDLHVRCASLHAQVLLKLVAWQARGAATVKDAVDLALLVEAGHRGIYEDEVWTDDEALNAYNYVPDLAGAFRIGRMIQRNFEPASIHKALEALTDDGPARIAAAAIRAREQRSTMVERFEALRTGITG